ncbi:hypothetical protein KIM67_05955 [Flagellimonas sp. 389]|uniref:hypothetical protein n=1 Tax=Flagellimonas sp. 389 TaxID=2835862 RepID=UPI001BD3140E|nr:hypothetical protein [Flagellimonas sp. 389]MBS9461947.1 hypothetical protein [Flagellimonas sp. 389]
MKKVKRLAVALVLVSTLLSCGGGSGKQPATAAGFSEIEKEIKNEFGEDAYFTDIDVVYDKSLGNIIGVTVTKEPNSLKMGQWNQTQGVWKQTSEITLEVPEGSQAADFMFQLDDKINLVMLGEVIEKSKKQLQDEKNLENPMLSMAYISFPDDGDISQAEYLVNLKPENGGTTFHFYYTLNGELRKMDY